MGIANMSGQTDLDKSLRLADEADKITMRYYRATDLVVKDKPDQSPVTQGDLEAEQRLKNIVVDEFHDNYLGEEAGGDNLTTGRLWIVDPIDATKNFMRGLPIWGTLIALNVDGETVAAVVSCPALGRRWWAAKGLGAWTHDVDGSIRRIHTSKVATVADSFILYSTPLHAWDKAPGTNEKAIQALLDSVWRYRAPGDMVNYMWVAEGAADVAFEPYPKQWDIEACKLIVTEAGGSWWTDATPQTPPDAERVIVATNGPLEAAVLKALGL